MRSLWRGIALWSCAVLLLTASAFAIDDPPAGSCPERNTAFARFARNKMYRIDVSALPETLTYTVNGQTVTAVDTVGNPVKPREIALAVFKEFDDEGFEAGMTRFNDFAPADHKVSVVIAGQPGIGIQPNRAGEFKTTTLDSDNRIATANVVLDLNNTNPLSGDFPPGTKRFDLSEPHIGEFIAKVIRHEIEHGYGLDHPTTMAPRQSSLNGHLTPNDHRPDDILYGPNMMPTGLTQCDKAKMRSSILEEEPSGGNGGQECGNGVVEGDEQCDGGENCSAECTLFPGAGPQCGDGNLDWNEQCDDGNNFVGDGCDSICVIEEDEGDECELPSMETCDDLCNDPYYIAPAECDLNEMCDFLYGECVYNQSPSADMIADAVMPVQLGAVLAVAFAMMRRRHRAEVSDIA